MFYDFLELHWADSMICLLTSNDKLDNDLALHDQFSKIKGFFIILRKWFGILDNLGKQEKIGNSNLYLDVILN